MCAEFTHSNTMVTRPDDIGGSASSPLGAREFVKLCPIRRPDSSNSAWMNRDGDLTIRAEGSSDPAAIAEVVTAAFRSPAEARLVEAIRQSPSFIPELSMVAEVDRRIVGHVMVSYAAVHDDDTQHRITNLSPLAVHPDVQGRGIGSALVRAVTARADARGEPAIVLEGSPAFYGRFGFEYSVPYGFTSRSRLGLDRRLLRFSSSATTTHRSAATSSIRRLLTW
jgi:putative acetyltransferase